MDRRRLRFVMSARFLLRSLSLRGSSFLLALLAIVVGATVTSTMLTIRADLTAKMSRELRRYGPNLLVTPREQGLPRGTSVTPDSAAAAHAVPANAASAASSAIVNPAAASAAATLDEQSLRSLPSVLRAAGFGRPGSRTTPPRDGSGRRPPTATPGSGEGSDRTPASERGGRQADLDRRSTEPDSTLTVSPLLIASGTIALARADDPRDARGSARAGGASAAGASAGSSAEQATVIGADFEALHQLSPAWQVQGAWPVTRAPACLVGSALARRAGLAPGAAAVVIVPGAPPARLTVSGIVSTGEAEDDQLFVPLLLLQEMTHLQRRASLAALSIDGGAAEVSRAADAISAALPAAAAHPLRRVAAAQGAILEKLGRMMALLTLVVLALSGLCLVTTLMTIVVEREGEIGLMRSIGAGDGEITRMFVGEVSLLGIVGGLAGFALGIGGARLIGSSLFGAAIEPRLGIAPVVLSISLVLCLASVLVPLRRALAVQPATALRGN